MKFILLFFSLSLNVYALNIGDSAPDFKLKGEDGKEYELSSFKGKVVVLEWLNHGCPFIKKHYNSNNMQATQKLAKDQGAVWLSIISSAPDKQGYVDAAEAKEEKQEKGSLANHVLLDSKGTVGRLYHAKTTPHMFIVGKKGEILYEGAIDSINSTSADDIKSADNYIKRAINEIAQGKKVSIAKSTPYGCSVKY